MLTTLASIGAFLDHGDVTQPEFPCTIDYPLLSPVPETLMGWITCISGCGSLPARTG